MLTISRDDGRLTFVGVIAREQLLDGALQRADELIEDEGLQVTILTILVDHAKIECEEIGHAFWDQDKKDGRKCVFLLQVGHKVEMK